LKAAPACENFDLVSVGIGDEEKPGDRLALVLKINKLARGKSRRREARMFGIQIANRNRQMPISVSKIKWICAAFVDRQLNLKAAFGIGQINQGEVVKFQPVGDRKPEGLLIEFDRASSSTRIIE
jgi:hypothetical protein